MILPEEFKSNGFDFAKQKANECDEIEIQIPEDVNGMSLSHFNTILRLMGFQGGQRGECYYHLNIINNKKFIVRHRPYNTGMKLALFIESIKKYDTKILNFELLQKEYIKFLPILISEINKAKRE